MVRWLLILCMALVSITSHAQNTKENQDDFEAFRAGIHEDFNKFRDEINREFIEFVRNPWKEFESVAPVPKPKQEPVPPVVIPKEDKDSVPVKSTPIEIDTIIKPSPITPQPKPIEPIPENDLADEHMVSVSLFGTTCSIRFYKNKEYSIKQVSEKGIADALTILATEKYDNFIVDCLKYRDELRLCDWAYLALVKKASEKACGNGTNESNLLIAYVLIQSGYKIRLAISSDKLYVLYASNHCVFDKSSYSVDGDILYGMEELPSNLRISRASFPEEQNVSLLITQQPLFSKKMSEKRTISSTKYPNVKVETQSNKNLLDFYSTYPSSYYDDNYMTQWSLYANTPMATEIQNEIYPVLKRELAGLSEYECVCRILNWVQTGFEYEYDDKVWGHDRTFFAEETLFYPYCDCEDRSILFTRLVRDLTNLDCILVYYPGHLATAVNFNSNMNGDYILLNRKKFVICDPTYIGAPVGVTMPKMNNSSAGVILLNR